MVSDRPRLDEIWLVALDPTRGSEIRKTRACLVVSPNELNDHLRTVIVAPMTTTERPYPSRVPVTFQGQHGQVALDQIRTVDRERFVGRVGVVFPKTARAALAVLVEMFTRQ